MTQYLLIAAVIVLALAFIERFAAARRWRSAAMENFEGIGAAHAELADVVKSTIEPMKHELHNLRLKEQELLLRIERLDDLTANQKQSLGKYPHS